MNMRMQRPSAALFLLTSLLLFGCEEDLGLREAVPEPFTLYGVLSPDLDIQSVRVYPLERFLTLPLEDPHGIVFTSTDLETGDQIVWQDTVLVAPNGQQDLIFWAPFRAEFGHRYRVEATRASDGARSYADVAIPLPVTVRLDEFDSPAITETNVRIDIEGEAFRILKPEIVYTITGLSDPSTFTFDISHQGSERPVEKGWALDVNLWADRYHIQAKFTALVGSGGIQCPIMALQSMALHLIVGAPPWDPPGGSFDPNLLSHQNALDNVENGLGFVGAGYRIAEPLFPSREAVEDACFVYVWE